MQRKISICIPTWNRPAMTIKAFNKVLNDDRVGEVVIYDDYSNEANFLELCQNLGKLSSPKIKIFTESNNWGVYIAKKLAVLQATNDWVIVFDSDNILDIDYLDVIFSIENWDKDILYQPEYLKPHFDFRKWSGLTISKENIRSILDKPSNKVDTYLNAMNCFVNRDSYLEVWESNSEANGNDSIWFNYLWLKSGKKVYLCPNLSYFHTVHNGSNYQSDKNAWVKVEKTINLLKQLK